MSVCCFSFVKAIAHYEQAADYYKGEESNRYRSLAFYSALKSDTAMCEKLKNKVISVFTVMCAH